MIPLSEFKKLPGIAALGLSDADIERLRGIEDRLADIVFDAWLRKRNPPAELAKPPKV